MKHTILLSPLAIAAALLLAGCSVGPDYKAPALSTPLHWLGLGGAPDLLADTNEDATKVNLDWWKVFNDPTLDNLMQQALTRNGDLRVAQARVAEARGARLGAQANLLPEIDGGGDAGRGNANGTNRTMNTSSASFDASWEIDLFGGNRRAAEAARARYRQADSEARLTRIQLLAEVARSYLDVRRLQQQLTLAQKNLADQEDTLRLVRAQQHEGVANNLVVAQNEAQAATTAAAIPQIEANLSASMNSLGVLVGAQPVEIAQTVGTVQPVPVSTPKVLVATPASVIAARPDVKAAERALAAATADQGVAIANWFPKISLTGLFGLQDLGTGSNDVWDAGGTISMPIIDFGRVRSLVRQADARQQAALATYEQTVLSALADVESSLVAYQKAVERAQKLNMAADASRNAFRLAKLQYTEGVASNLDVIVAEQQQLTTDDAQAAGEAAVGQSLAALYKALGGGM